MKNSAFYKAIVVRKISRLEFDVNFEKLNFDRLRESMIDGSVIIKNKYSGLNYKDSMSLSGHPAVTRRFPHIPGIDAAGVVVESRNSSYKLGSEVVVYARNMGMNQDGGFSEYVLLKNPWIEKKPEGLSLRDFIAFGTAGFTAALAVKKICELFGKDVEKKILINGASGGIGSLSIWMLSSLGYKVIVLTSDLSQSAYLKSIGANEVVHSELFTGAEVSQNLLPEAYDAVIDVLGGRYLSHSLKMICVGGVAMSIGMIDGTKFDANVLPFILRGISLVGINAEHCTYLERASIWKWLAANFCFQNMPNGLCHEINFESFFLIASGRYEAREVFGEKPSRLIVDFDNSRSDLLC